MLPGIKSKLETNIFPAPKLSLKNPKQKQNKTLISSACMCAIIVHNNIKVVLWKACLPSKTWTVPCQEIVSFWWEYKYLGSPIICDEIWFLSKGFNSWALSHVLFPSFSIFSIHHNCKQHNTFTSRCQQYNA